MCPGVSLIWDQLATGLTRETVQQGNGMRPDVGSVPTARAVAMDDFESTMLAVECLAAGIRNASLGHFPGFATMGDINLVEVADVGFAQRRLALRTLIRIPLRDGHAAVGTFEGHACAIANSRTSAIWNPEDLVGVFELVLYRFLLGIDPSGAHRAAQPAAGKPDGEVAKTENDECYQAKVNDLH